MEFHNSGGSLGVVAIAGILCILGLVYPELHMGFREPRPMSISVAQPASADIDYDTASGVCRRGRNPAESSFALRVQPELPHSPSKFFGRFNTPAKNPPLMYHAIPNSNDTPKTYCDASCHHKESQDRQPLSVDNKSDESRAGSEQTNRETDKYDF
jgi:hypothetical protein